MKFIINKQQLIIKVYKRDFTDVLRWLYMDGYEVVATGCRLDYNISGELSAVKMGYREKSLLNHDPKSLELKMKLILLCVLSQLYY